jgi:hypothetical protein
MAEAPKTNTSQTETSKTDNLKSFDAYRDENGQFMGQDEPTDVARPADLKRRMGGDPSGEAETARLASDSARLDSIGGGSIATVDETEAEVSKETIERLSDPRIRPENGTN